MKIEITVKRQSMPNADSRLQTFFYDGNGNLTIADWLSEVNQNEAKTDRIAWECGCMEKKCGACAVICPIKLPLDEIQARANVHSH